MDDICKLLRKNNILFSKHNDGFEQDLIDYLNMNPKNNISDEAFAKEFYKNILLFYKKTKKKDIMKPILRALSYYDTKSLRLLATGNNKDEIISNVVKTVEKLIGGLTK